MGLICCPLLKSPSSVSHLMPRVVCYSDLAAGNRDQPCVSARRCPHGSQVASPAPGMGSCSPPPPTYPPSPHPTPALTHVLLTSAVSGHFSLCSCSWLILCSAGSVHFDLVRPLTLSFLHGSPSDSSCVPLPALQPKT